MQCQKEDKATVGFRAGISIPKCFVGYDLKETFGVDEKANNPRIRQVAKTDCGKSKRYRTWCAKADGNVNNEPRECSVKGN